MVKAILSWFTGFEATAEPAYKAREVWMYTHIDSKTRHTQQRPVLVYRKASDGMFWGLPLSKVTVRGKALYVPRLKNGKRLSALSQMRTLKAGRLVRKIGTAGEKEFSALNSSIVRLMAETAPIQVPRTERKLVRKAVVRPRYERALPSPFSPVYILQPR